MAPDLVSLAPHLDELDALVDHIGGSDLSAYADGESVRHFHLILARLETVVTEATAAFHNRRRTLRELADDDNGVGPHNGVGPDN